MGKCSGLKGGGHHRRALDVAQAKQAAKANQKQEQVQVGKRAAACRELLTLLEHGQFASFQRSFSYTMDTD